MVGLMYAALGERPQTVGWSEDVIRPSAVHDHFFGSDGAVDRQLVLRVWRRRDADATSCCIQNELRQPILSIASDR